MGSFFSHGLLGDSGGFLNESVRSKGNKQVRIPFLREDVAYHASFFNPGQSLVETLVTEGHFFMIDS